jgi:hypothetical protein
MADKKDHGRKEAGDKLNGGNEYQRQPEGVAQEFCVGGVFALVNEASEEVAGNDNESDEVQPLKETEQDHWRFHGYLAKYKALSDCGFGGMKQNRSWLF